MRYDSLMEEIVKSILAAEPGARVEFQTRSGPMSGTIVREDRSTFPPTVVLLDDSGTEHSVPIGIGWPD